MKTLNVHEAKTYLSAVLAEVADDGASFVICRNGHPVADLVPHRKKSRLTLHPRMSKLQIKYSPTEPLSEDEWPQEDR
ncbi:MAG: type II toxin-antitoxin system prevent-host-death family antitoxin [Verrucomicrobia bacterium]|nr:type II toxin-antitoxin system prevent-host-death family antitoxin [Verrucomicrobiota bacterium]